MNTNIEIHMVLGDLRTTVPATYYDSILKQIKEVLDYIEPGTICTAIDLCGGKAGWDEVVKKRPTLAGKCIADMVRSGKLPLEQVGCEHDYPRKYRRLADN